MLADILNSIVNNSTEILDNNKPYSFIKFLQFYKQSVDVKYIINEYNEYIQQWYITKNNQVDVNLYKQLTQQQYIALLKEITLDYTSTEEKRFLSQLTISDEIVDNQDKLNNLLDIILPFYIKKINNICNYYLEKRNDLKLHVNKLLDINTIDDARKTIKSLIIDELTTNNAEYSIDLDDIPDIKEVLDVDIDELYDNDDYFEKNNNLSGYNSNEINYKSFYNYDEAVIDAIRQYPFFLLDNDIHAFSVNPSLTTDDINYLPIKDFINNAKSDDINDVVLNLQKSLVKKYTGTDYYYITTDTNNKPTSGLLVDADNSILNILNVNLLNTPIIEENNYNDIRRIGLNFKPDKFGLLFYNTNNLKYEIDTTKLSANSTYVFPNPNKYSDYNVPLIWVIDNDKNKLNYSSQYAYGTPISDPLIQYFYSYFSIEQYQDSLNRDKIVFNGFEQYSNGKTITRSKFDSFGNEYILFKDINYLQSHSYSSEKNINKILNGNLDSFSYYTSLPINISLSGEFYYTLPMGDFGVNNFEYNTSFYRKFDKYIDGYIINVESLGLSSYLTNTKDWPNLPNISYEILVDGGASSIVDSNSTGEYTLKIPQNNYQLSSCSFTASEMASMLYDGGLFYTSDEYVTEDIPLIILNNDTSEYNTISSISDKNELYGEIYIKNSITGDISKSSTVLSAIYNKYNVDDEQLYTIYEELNDKVNDIDVINDVVIISTENYYVYDKIIVDNNGNITKSPYSPSFIYKNNNSLERASTYFYIEKNNTLVYAQLHDYRSELNSTADYGFIAPILKLINLNNFSVKTVEITNMSFIRSNFYWGGISKIIKIDTPKLIYNMLNNLYNLSIICRDSFDKPYLYNMSFINNVDYLLLYSNTFYDIKSQTQTINLSSLNSNNTIINKKGYIEY